MTIELKQAGLWRRISDHNNPRSLSSRIRLKRIKRLIAMIDRVHLSKDAVSILDIGGEEVYWRPIQQLSPVGLELQITILNLTKRGESNGIFTHVVGDGCALRYSDQSFDIAHSNSVIEHVGDWCAMEAFARETSRVGAAYFVQSPAFTFPIEPHFGLLGFHWLPRSARIALVQRIGCGHYKSCQTREEAIELVDSARLLTAQQMHTLFPDGQIEQEKFAGMTKSFIAIRDS